MAILALPLTLFLTAPAAKPVSTAVSAPRPPAVAAAPRVEVAFVLDTTGSMGGLIDGAKRRIWTIARRVGEGRPRPELRVALVGYRDRGDAYVTRVHDFSADMDTVYARLTAFDANGGGDTPEHVSAALSAAVHRISWSPGPSLKLIFLVGDAPPHTDYQDGFDYRRHVREARRRGIGVAAVQCGEDDSTAQVWREVAQLGDGEYARIDSQGGMPQRVTPMDAELARLNGELAATVVAGGRPEERADAERKLAGRVAMSAPAAAEAAPYYASARSLADHDLVAMSELDQKKELDALGRRPAEAPAALKGKSTTEALAYLKQQQARRDQLRTRILQLEKDRQAYLDRAQPRTADGFDAQVIGFVQKRAQAAGIKY